MKKEKHGIDLKDCVLSKEDSASFYARVISKNPKEVKAYKNTLLTNIIRQKNLMYF
jgi:hypothetical protein